MKSLFSEEFRFDKLSKQGDPLEKLAQSINFEHFRLTLLHALEQSSTTPTNKGGRPSFDVVLMFKILIVQRLYNLSDDQTEYAILDRLSFMRFLNLGIESRVPDSKTIWAFRDQLTQANAIQNLFHALDRLLVEHSLIVGKGSMIDATITEAPIQRNTREENAQIKNEQVPEQWKNNPHKCSQKDVDARWVKHNEKTYYGYKNHVKVDIKSKLITRYVVTTASVHDSQVLDALLDEKDNGKPLYADSAYSGEPAQEILDKHKVCSRVHRKASRGSSLARWEKVSNKYKSKTRARVEHVFAFMTNSMNGIRVQARSLKRNASCIGLMNIAYNLMRVVQLKQAI
jgi:transposase, IS5 family